MRVVQAAFVEYLVDPDRGTQADFARAHGVAEKTLSRWKKDSDFRSMWDRRCAELNVDPDRVQRLIESIYARALDGDVRAQKLYLEYTEKFTPKRVVIEDRSPKDLSDTELADALEEGARHLRVVGE